MTRRTKRSGFTLVEVITATTILMMAIGMAMAGFLYVLTSSTRSNVQDELDAELQVAMESLKYDLRLSSLAKMHFFKPTNETEFTAISFPLCRDDDGDGLIELATNGLIAWDATRIYHVWKGAPSQLRCTTFDPRDETLTDAEREAQIECVVTNGDGTIAQNGSNSSMRVVFENLFDWSIVPIGSSYDCYNPTVIRDENAILGSFVMTNGEWNIKFTVEGKNILSSGYNIGLDSLVISPCGYPREAESLPMPYASGASVITQYMESGSWDGNHQLVFPATAADQLFYLTVRNDGWQETHFRGTGARHEDTTAEFDTTLTPYDYVLKIDGEWGYGWYAAEQTGDDSRGLYSPLRDPNDTLRGCAVRLLLRGDEMPYGGWIDRNSDSYFYCWMQAGGTSSFEQLWVTDVFIAEAASSSNMIPDIVPGTSQALTQSGTNVPSGSGGSWWYKVPYSIREDKSYVVSFLVKNNPKAGHGGYFNEQRDPGGHGCWILPEGNIGNLTEANWSSKTNVVQTNRLYAAGRVYMGYVSNGTFVSQIFDTGLDAPDYQTIDWNHLTPGTVAMRIRTAANSDMSDAPAWTNVSPVAKGFINPGDKRYIQFQAKLTGVYAYTTTPRLKDVTITWAGETAVVDIRATVTKAPNYGIFKITVDEEELTTGVGIEMEIYRDVYGFSEVGRITSALTAEVEPRNTGR